MKNQTVKKLVSASAVMVLSAALLAGCGGNDSSDGNSGTGSSSSTQSASGTAGEDADQAVQAGENVTELEVCFGDDGEPFALHLEDNDTAKAIAGYVGTTEWRLPIYENDEDADYSVMQYYDIPSRYDIPSDPQTITSAKAGEVYYSDPNRIILYYKDKDGISEEYTKVGTFDATDEFVSAVENNPVIEGWSNKIVLIREP